MNAATSTDARLADLTVAPKSFNGGHTNLAAAGLSYAKLPRRVQRRCVTDMVLHAWRMAADADVTVALVPTNLGLAAMTDWTRADMSNGGYLVTPAGDVAVVTH